MTFMENQIARSEKIIARWRGRPATMHDLVKLAAKSLHVIVPGDEPGKNLYVACIDPLFICGPVEWTNSYILLRPCNLENGEEGVELIDEASGVRIVSHTFEIKENVKLKDER